MSSLYHLSMGTTHIPVAEAARDLRELLDRVRAGEDIVIDDGKSTPVRLAPASPSPNETSISEVIAGLKVREMELGYPLRMGADFADDLEEIIGNRKPRDTNKWD
jgi:antitoxin (DNA-binding transcriptional repressor) of toxin-antitoxin stability system